MRDESAFEGTAFLGLSRDAKRDAYRLSLFAKHLGADEMPLAFLPIRDGTLLVTDRRLLEFRAHLGIDGSWNVRRFLGYEIEFSVPRDGITALEYREGPPLASREGYREGEEWLLLTTRDGSRDVLVARGPSPVLTRDDVAALRAAALGPQPK